MRNFRRLIVPVDGSAAANRGVAFAVELAQTDGAAVDVCSVVDETAIMIPMAEGALFDPASMMDAVDAAARDDVDAAVTCLRDARIEAGGTILRGNPVAEIHEFVQRREADALVLGTNGRNALERMFMGSVTLALLRVVDVPVVTVHADDVLSRGPMLVALDASSASVAALECAIARARAGDAALLLLHVFEESRVEQCASALGLRHRSARRQALTEAEDALDDAVERVRAAGLTCATEMQFGAPAELILAAAERHGSASIAIGTHGPAALKRLMLGSVSDSVIRNARVPVYVVHRQKPAPATRSTSTHETSSRDPAELQRTPV